MALSALFLLNKSFLTGFDRSLQPFYNVLFVAYNWGNFAVEIFWSLSGFIFFWKYATSIYEARVTAKKFFVFRFSRLYPLHILTLTAIIVLQWIYTQSHAETFVYDNNDYWHLGLNLFFASDWGFDKGLSFNGPVWSISVEVLAYLVFFALARRIQFNWRAITAIIILLIIAKMSFPWVKDIILCQLYFFIGGAIYFVTHKYKQRIRFTSAISTIIASAFVYVNWVTDGKVHTFVLIAVSSALLFIFIAIGAAMKNNKKHNLSVSLGNLTYSSYMIHFPVQIMFVTLTDCLGISRTIYYEPLVMIFFIVATFALAQSSYFLFEFPIQEWMRRKFVRESQRHPLPVPTESSP